MAAITAIVAFTHLLAGFDHPILVRLVHPARSPLHQRAWRPMTFAASKATASSCAFPAITVTSSRRSAGASRFCSPRPTDESSPLALPSFAGSATPLLLGRVPFPTALTSSDHATVCRAVNQAIRAVNNAAVTSRRPRGRASVAALTPWHLMSLGSLVSRPPCEPPCRTTFAHVVSLESRLVS